jgi:hypothetical protein
MATIGDAGTDDKPVGWINAQESPLRPALLTRTIRCARCSGTRGRHRAEDACARVPVLRQMVDGRGEIADPQARDAIEASVTRLAGYVRQPSQSRC